MGKRPRSNEEEEKRVYQLEKALSDPLRAWVLAQINDAPSAAGDLAERSGRERNLINYHLSVLVKYECAELMDEVKVGGVLKKIYRGTTRMMIDLDLWKKLGADSRTGISVKILGEFIERSQKALEGGTFDSRIDRVAANHKPRLDDEGWQEAVAILHRAHEEVEGLEATSIERNPDYLNRKPFTISLYGFESPPGTQLPPSDESKENGKPKKPKK